MKTKREIIENIVPHEVTDGSLPRYYPAEVEVFMDEYAEEYAKAFMDYCYQKSNLRGLGTLFNEFKESLKK